MKLRKAARVIILGILNILILLPKVWCSGVFELRLTRFENENGLNANGSCCNGIRSPSPYGTGFVCGSSCHTFFTVCLTHYQTVIPNEPKCTFGSYTTAVLGGNNVDFENSNSFLNPVKFQFANTTWPGTFSLIIEAWHDATLEGVRPGSPREKISRMAVQRTLQKGPDWSNFIQETPQTRLEYKYRVMCNPDFYGPGCSILCRPRDDHFGHYSCNEAGEKVCLRGWKGQYCDEAICLAGCTEGQGYCDTPNECKCRIGWEGPLCTQCIKYPGCQNGTCEKPWQCICLEGWGGLFCNQDLNYCTHHSPCKNGGVCQNSGEGSYFCSCPVGFTGTNCEQEVDDCINLPCLNGGTCDDIGSSFQCRCPNGFTGKRCDVIADQCACQNGATCVEGLGTYTCICKSGYTGRNCERDVYDCEPNPCQNNGRCIDEVNGFKCHCSPGFSGRFCEVNDDDCTHSPCRNGGTCEDGVNEFRCRCVPGFVGELCEDNVDDCVLMPCANGGICHDLVNNFTCTCRPGFTGKFCTIDIDECASAPCRNGGKCTQGVDEYHCACPVGFSGKNCQYLPGQPQDTTTENTDTFHVETTPVSNTRPANVSVTRQQNGGQLEPDELSTTQLLLIVLLGVGIPLIAIIVAVTILLCRKRRLRETPSKEEEENQQNSINNKLSNIFTTIPQSSSTLSNLTSKISNEEQDFNTLKSNKSNRSLEKSSRPNRPISQIYPGEKPINKQLFYTKDLKVHSQHRDFEKTTKKLDNDGLTIDPSILDIRDYCSTNDIHIIGKPINRDTINRNSLLLIDAQNHNKDLHRHSSHSSYYSDEKETQRHSSYYGEDVLATEV